MTTALQLLSGAYRHNGFITYVFTIQFHNVHVNCPLNWDRPKFHINVICNIINTNIINALSFSVKIGMRVGVLVKKSTTRCELAVRAKKRLYKVSVDW